MKPVPRSDPVPALVPGFLRQPPPVRPVLPALSPAPTDPACDGALAVAHLDRTGRFFARPLLRLLGWQPGDRITVGLNGSALSVTADAAGAFCLGDRGELTLHAPLRRSAGIETVIVVLAVPSRWLLIVRPAHAVVALLLDHLDGTETDDVLP
ncbi:hypothetical protein [Nocardia cyriacigeorgica]|uniref:hypothetical protein n=1 Tax=Nocardia cyriacigeorgica TaxID=135487 RepID=UPI0024538397|nr:hypothetical protein [Nocardia cyriacigeorgica]